MVLLAACAVGPRFDTAGTSEDLMPRSATEQHAGQKVIWGGVVVSSANLADATQFEILAYPLDSQQKPNTHRPPDGRFMALQKGYVETADYRPGRLVTVSGILTGTRPGKVGDAPYTYPVLDASRLYLWPEQNEQPVWPRFSVGFGVIFDN
jgi:outer membrane lipoprotein